jgi:hypothetical protein
MVELDLLGPTLGYSFSVTLCIPKEVQYEIEGGVLVSLFGGNTLLCPPYHDLKIKSHLNFPPKDVGSGPQERFKLGEGQGHDFYYSVLYEPFAK